MDLAKLYLKKEEAEKRGMTPHAGPYNLNLTSQIFELVRCLEDFKLRPERKFALVPSEYHHDGRKLRSWVDIWADGADNSHNYSVHDRIEGQEALEELRRVFG